MHRVEEKMNYLTQICRDLDISVYEIWKNKISLEEKKLIIRYLGLCGLNDKEIKFQTNLALPFIRHELKQIVKKTYLPRKKISIINSNNKLKTARNFIRVVDYISGEIKYVQK